MIFAHGQLLPDGERPALLAGLEAEINATRASKTLTPETVISAVDALGRRLAAGEFDDLLRRFLPPNVTLTELLPLLRRETLEAKLTAELGQDPFAPVRRDRITTYRVPLGTLLHIAPGNQPGLPVYSVLEGLLTGNVNLLKLPHADKGLSLAALSLLCEAAPQLAPFLYAFDLPSSQRAEVQILADLADGVVTWGSDAAVRSARELAGPNCKLIEWGHRLGFAYVAGFEDETAELTALAEHILSTGQRLCSSCQVIYLDPGLYGEQTDPLEFFCKRFLTILEAARNSQNAPPGSGALATLNGHTALLQRIVEGKALGEKIFRGRGCSVIARPDDALELSPMEGNVLVKLLPQERLLETLRREKCHLQTAALLCDRAQRPALTEALLRAGLTRVTRAGDLSEAFLGEAHDGEYPLQRYTRLVDVEN